MHRGKLTLSVCVSPCLSVCPSLSVYVCVCVCVYVFMSHSHDTLGRLADSQLTAADPDCSTSPDTNSQEHKATADSLHHLGNNQRLGLVTAATAEIPVPNIKTPTSTRTDFIDVSPVYEICIGIWYELVIWYWNEH